MFKPSIIPLYPGYINFFFLWLGEGCSHHFDKNINDMGSAWKLEKTHISLESVIYSSVLDILHLWAATVSPDFSCITKRPWSPEVKNVPSAYIQSLPLWFCWWMELHARCIALKNTEHRQNADRHVDRMWGTYWLRKANRYLITIRTDLGKVRSSLRMWSALS